MHQYHIQLQMYQTIVSKAVVTQVPPNTTHGMIEDGLIEMQSIAQGILWPYNQAQLSSNGRKCQLRQCHRNRWERGRRCSNRCARNGLGQQRKGSRSYTRMKQWRSGLILIPVCKQAHRRVGFFLFPPMFCRIIRRIPQFRPDNCHDKLSSK